MTTKNKKKKLLKDKRKLQEPITKINKNQKKKKLVKKEKKIKTKLKVFFITFKIINE